MAPVTGSLLVATPLLVDATFAQTVVLLLDHDEDGTLGVVLNRPTELAATDALPSVLGLPAEPAVLFEGGPVAPQNAIAVGSLASAEPDPLWFRRVFGQVGLVDVDALESGEAHVHAMRIYAGYAGWSPGQLDAELAEGAWFVFPLLASDVFCPTPENLWRDVLRRQPAPLSFLSTWTPDPDSN